MEQKAVDRSRDLRPLSVPCAICPDDYQKFDPELNRKIFEESRTIFVQQIEKVGKKK